MRNSVRRIAAATGVLVAASVLPIVTTAPAYATTSECKEYLGVSGYKVGPNVNRACRMVGEGDWLTRQANISICYASLQVIGVKPTHAQTACELGTRG